MRLYICNNGDYVGTQAEAKAKGKGWEQVEVPTDKAGLIDYLNTRWNAISAAWSADVEEAAAASPPPAPKPPAAPSCEASAIEEFILDRATVAEVGRIFEALGTRFAEARR